jgi:pantoate--beta-alanine ligase
MQTPLTTVRTAADLLAQVRAWRATGARVALVPTMGALHAGHMALVAAALAAADRVVASIFVNPTQFGPTEDLARYPRREAADAEMLARAGCHLLYAPDAAAMYPEGFATSVHVAGLTDILCGAHRPGHFDGVATVVAKLLNQAQPDVALFGEKDYQQLLVIRRMAADLDIPVQIVGVPTVREPDGLALSSRNAYLTPDERKTAALFPKVLQQARERLLAGEGVEAVLVEARERLTAAGLTPDYVELRDAANLAANAEPPARLLAAVRLGSTRLIDNMAVG